VGEKAIARPQKKRSGDKEHWAGNSSGRQSRLGVPSNRDRRLICALGGEETLKKKGARGGATGVWGKSIGSLHRSRGQSLNARKKVLGRVVKWKRTISK